MNKNYKIKSLAGLDDAAIWLLKACKDKKQFAFYGEMGSGKTTFIKSLCKYLGAIDVVNSPTFAIVNEYQSEKNSSLYHLDLYRIEDVKEAYDFGIEEYLGSDNYCFIEWPAKIEEIIGDEIQKVYITVLDNNIRQLEIRE
ncbi:MAG: tRNA (adenosine(37)-N6)-threonylcarbamoyltransferase complex ATPase subunit type 1 TsaE [Bacteroidota bacterium]|nr:tRNA (adenosine(37)-N6)-threonylcarbamoyltransferase complex ATPase subunit type 1 TsaE [Bacteroidota bacterium]